MVFRKLRTIAVLCLKIEPVLGVQKLYEAKNGFTKLTKKLRQFIQAFDQSTLTLIDNAIKPTGAS